MSKWIGKFIDKDAFDIEILCQCDSKEKAIFKVESDIKQYIKDAEYTSNEYLTFPKPEILHNTETIYYGLNPTYASVCWIIHEEIAP